MTVLLNLIHNESSSIITDESDDSMDNEKEHCYWKKLQWAINKLKNDIINNRQTFEEKDSFKIIKR